MLAKARGGGGMLSPTMSLSDEQKGLLHRIVSHDWFDRFVLFLIFANCIVMILQKEVRRLRIRCAFIQTHSQLKARSQIDPQPNRSTAK